MPTLSYFDIDGLVEVRRESLQEARALKPGPERNQMRQIARSLKRLIGIQLRKMGDQKVTVALVRTG